MTTAALTSVTGTPALAEGDADGLAAGEMRREAGAGTVLAEAAEVDDPAAAGLGCLPAEAGGGRAVPLFPIGARSDRVDEIEGFLDALKSIGHSLVDVPLHDLDVTSPRHTVEAARVPREAAHAAAGFEQRRHEAGADIAGGAGDEGERATCHFSGTAVTGIFTPVRPAHHASSASASPGPVGLRRGRR